MVKLEVDGRGHPTFSSGIYFHTMEDCRKFIHVFKDHWCNIPWKDPVEADNFPEMTRYHRESMDKDPVKRAESDLNWGFSLARSIGIGLTSVQITTVDRMMRSL